MTLWKVVLCGVYSASFLVGVSHAEEPAECDVDGFSGTTYYFGSSLSDRCEGGAGQPEEFWGYGDIDYLTGQDRMDKIRGATGNDVQSDRCCGAIDDDDNACDGSGKDHIHFDDGDGADHLHRIAGDGSDDTYTKNRFDSVDTHAECPT